MLRACARSPRGAHAADSRPAVLSVLPVRRRFSNACVCSVRHTSGSPARISAPCWGAALNIAAPHKTTDVQNRRAPSGLCEGAGQSRQHRAERARTARAPGRSVWVISKFYRVTVQRQSPQIRRAGHVSPPVSLRGLAQDHSWLGWRLSRHRWVLAALDQELFFRKHFRCTKMDKTVCLPASSPGGPRFQALAFWEGGVFERWLRGLARGTRVASRDTCSLPPCVSWAEVIQQLRHGRGRAQDVPGSPRHGCLGGSWPSGRGIPGLPACPRRRNSPCSAGRTWSATSWRRPRRCWRTGCGRGSRC